MSEIIYSSKCRYCGNPIIFIKSGNIKKNKPTYCCEPDRVCVKTFQRGGKLFVSPHGLPFRGKEISEYEYDEYTAYGYRVHWCDSFPGRDEKKKRG